MTSPHPQQRQDGSELFTTEVKPDKPYPTLEREQLADAQLVQYVGIRVVEYVRDGKPQRTRKHLLAALAGDGPWFGVWGTYSLDSQLRKVRLGAIIRLAYVGKTQEADGTEQHRWNVAMTTASKDQVDQLRTMEPWPERERMLVGYINQAAENDRQRREARQAADATQDADDTDLPF